MMRLKEGKGLSALLSPIIFRLLRAALGWSRDRLAIEANLMAETVRSFERGTSLPIPAASRYLQPGNSGGVS